MNRQVFSIDIRNTVTTHDFNTARALFSEYVASLPFDLNFQDFEHELLELEDHYKAPGGCILIAWADGMPAGCIAIRPFSDTRAELKRMYLRPAYRGVGLGKQLLDSIMEKAREAGYKSILLDTVPSMQQAIHLYKKAGFTEIAPYRFNPIKGALFMEAFIESR